MLATKMIITFSDILWHQYPRSKHMTSYDQDSHQTWFVNLPLFAGVVVIRKSFPPWSNRGPRFERAAPRRRREKRPKGEVGTTFFEGKLLGRWSNSGSNHECYVMNIILGRERSTFYPMKIILGRTIQCVDPHITMNKWFMKYPMNVGNPMPYT